MIYQATDQAGASVTKKITVVVPKRSITPDETPSTPSEPEQPVIPYETSQDISIESKPSRVPHQELNTSSKVGQSEQTIALNIPSLSKIQKKTFSVKSVKNNLFEESKTNNLNTITTNSQIENKVLTSSSILKMNNENDTKSPHKNDVSARLMPATSANGQETHKLCKFGIGLVAAVTALLAGIGINLLKRKKKH